jgi:nitrogen fixation NifU-like protein
MSHGSFSATLMDHFLHPRHTGPLPDPDGEGWAGHPHSSRYMRIQVVLDETRQIVLDARFATYGCAPAIACGSFLCEWATGRPMSEVASYSGEELTDALGGLPPARRFCADLAVDAMRAALGVVEAKAVVS